METIEHFAKISLVARLLGRENLISREEVMRLQELRGTYGIKAPAPICADDGDSPDAIRRRCQVDAGAVESAGARLVPDVVAPELRRQARRTGNSVNIPRTLRAHRRRTDQ